MQNGPVEGAITSILKHVKVYRSKTHLNLFVCFFLLIFAENVMLLNPEHNYADPIRALNLKV